MNAVCEGQGDRLDAIAETDMPWLARFDGAVRDLATSGRPFQAYDVRSLGVPEPHHPNVWGAAIRRHAHSGLIVQAGRGHSARPTTNGSGACLWVGASR